MSIEGFLEVSKEDEASAAGKMPLTEACGNAVIGSAAYIPMGCSEDEPGHGRTCADFFKSRYFSNKGR